MGVMFHIVIYSRPVRVPRPFESRDGDGGLSGRSNFSGTWVGGGAVLCPGVRIGPRSVIGAGSVVTRDAPEGVFAAGNPCRVLREIPVEQIET